MAAGRATFCVGRVTPGTFGAQALLPAKDSPLNRFAAPSGATNGDWQPGDWMRGNEIELSDPKDRSAGHEVSCDPA
jgi:hypothetical protein